ncbi:MAG TPA: 30S ribosome-binding factor RbfA [Acidimicrobiales bacterium]|jgi:ribosome-binding factor A
MAPKRGYSRLERVNEALREVIAEELELIDDEQLALVTVTGVNAQSDLRRAVVWFSALSSGKPPAEVAEVLGTHRVRLQAAVGHQLRLKRTPELVFQSDPAIDVGTRVEDILRAIGPDHHADQEHTEEHYLAGDNEAAGGHRPPEGV